MSLLWTGVCRIYFNAYTEAPLFWSVDNGDNAAEAKCPRVVMAGNFETVAAPEQKVEPQACDYKDQNIRLTPLRFDLLVCFAEHAGQLLTHRVIIQDVWGA